MDRACVVSRECAREAAPGLSGSVVCLGLWPCHVRAATSCLQVRKLETLLYELSLVERSGRVRAEPVETPSEPAAASTVTEQEQE